MRKPHQSIRPNADDPFEGWTSSDAVVFWKARRVHAARIVDTVRKSLIAQGARRSLTLDKKLIDFIEEIDFAIEVGQWRLEYSKLQNLRPLLKSLSRTINLLDRAANQYVLSVNSQPAISIPTLVGTLTKVLDNATKITKEKADRRNVIRDVLPRIDAFFRESTGAYLTQAKQVFLTTSKAENGGLSGKPHPAFAYALINAVAPHLPNSNIQTSLKNYIIERNRKEGIPSIGRPQRDGKKRRPKTKA